MTCEVCLFWSRDCKDFQWGSCHRMPPSLVDTASQVDVGEAAAYWPNTIESDWCGEFKEKEIE